MILKPNRLRLSIGLAAMLALASCTQDELADSTDTLPEGMYPLEIASATLSVEGSEQPWTKVAETTDGTGSEFTANDAIAVSLGGETATYTYDGSDWTADEPLYWESTSSATVSAWYPATDGTISLADQTDGLAYVLKGSGEGSYQSAVDLTFTHQLAKIRVKLAGKIEGITSVSINGSYTSCTHSQGNISATDAATGDIAMHQVDATTWEANVVPGQEISTITVNDTEADLTTSVIPEAGKMHTIDLTLTNKQGYDISSDGTYIVYNAEGLLTWANDASSNKDTNCTLAADIDMNDLSSSWPLIHVYEGTFDGAGHTISHLNISNDDDPAGFITSLYGGTVKGLRITDASVTAMATYAGGIAGYVDNDGQIIGCSFSGTVFTDKICAGGITGYNAWGTVSACYSTAIVTATNYSGGIVGNNKGLVSACYYYSTEEGSISAVGREGIYKGSIVGYNIGIVETCYSNVSITGGDPDSDNGTLVTGDWSEAMNKMNEYLQQNNIGWCYTQEGATEEDVPLVLVPVDEN